VKTLGRILVLAGSAVVALTACEAVIGADFDDIQTSECRHAAPPKRSSVVNAGGEEEVLVAITSIDLGDEELPDGRRPYREIGFDLDGVCSNLGERPTCRTFAWAKGDPTDGVDGIDNGGGALMHAELEVFNIAPFTSKTVTQGIRSGTVAPVALLRVRNYNLRVKDDSVTLDWYLAEAKGVTPETKPLLDGSDAWPIWDGTLEQGTSFTPSGSLPNSRFRDADAYVEDYTLVARLPPGTPLKLQNVSFMTEGLTISLKLGYDPLRVSSGVIGGMLSAKELFRKMPEMTQAFKIGSICREDPSYPTVKAYFCRFIESRSDARTAPDESCDAISLGMRFETTIVKPGALSPEPTFKGCSPENDPSTDTCENPVVMQ
jgi:hypothetical protein